VADFIRRLTIDLVRRLSQQLNGRIPKGRSRSSDWPRFRRAYLKSYRECFACGRRRAWYRWLDAHHLVPFYAEPGLELEQTDLSLVLAFNLSGCRGSPCNVVPKHNTGLFVWIS